MMYINKIISYKVDNMDIIKYVKIKTAHSSSVHHNLNSEALIHVGMMPVEV